MSCYNEMLNNKIFKIYRDLSLMMKIWRLNPLGQSIQTRYQYHERWIDIKDN